MKTLTKHFIFGLILIPFLAKGQDFTGYYKNIDNIMGLGFVTRLNLKADSTFQYSFHGDLFNDHAEGTYLKTKRVIKLKYTTLDYYVDTIYQERQLDTKPTSTVKIREQFKWPNPIAHLWPTELKLKRNSLIVYKIKDSDSNPKKLRLKLKKVPSDN